MPATREHSTLCVLVGAGEFDSPHPFPALRGGKARNGVAAMARALSAWEGGRRSVRVQQIVDPSIPEQIRAALARDPGEPAPDLLIFYYVGHGYRDPHDHDKLYLAVRRSDARHMATTALAVTDLVGLVSDHGASESVVILDCCYSGDALNHKSTALDRPFGTLTSSEVGKVISPGPDEASLTAFTAALVSVLEERPRTLHELGVALRALSDDPDRQPRDGYPWFPAEVSVAGGAHIVLPPGPLEAKAHDGGGEGNTFRQTLRARLRRSRRIFAGIVGVLALALLGRLVWSLVQDATADCPPPLELRLVTAPEEVSGMRELVRDFEKSSTNRRDVAGAEQCRLARFTVYGASLDALTRAFGQAGAWGGGPALTEVGPQPDVWVTQSSAAVSQVRSGLVPPDGVGREFLTYTTLMKDEPALVLTEQARQRLGLPAADTRPGQVGWRRLRELLLDEEDGDRPVLYRPNPTVSGAGLAHTLGMYAKPGTGSFGGSLLPEEETGRLETELISRGHSPAGSEQALCALKEPEAAGALVGMRQALLYERRPGYCSGGAVLPVRAHRYVLTGGPPLDYQLVEIAWPADDRAERAAAVARFSDWVHGDAGERSLRRAQYRPRGDYLTPLSDKRVTDLLGRFHRAHPELHLTVLFDISGSMRENGRFEAAERAVAESLGRLAPSDRYRVLFYPDDTDGSGVRRQVADWTPVPGKGAGLRLDESALHDADDRYANLLDALRTVAGRLPGHDERTRHAVLLVTDGDYVAGEGPRVGELGRVAADLGSRDVPVVVASMRPYGCAADKETGVIAGRSGGQCERLSGDLAARLARQVAALTEGRPE